MPTSVRLRDLPWTQVDEGGLIVVPLGSVEQHGPHLPLDTDAVIARAVAEGLVSSLWRDGVPALLAPALPYGSSGEHQDFPGTLSIGTGALTHVLVELGRSATTWASGIVFVSGHGGNHEAGARAVESLRSEGRTACWVPCRYAGGDAHAGRTETSLLLCLAPSRVALELAAAGNPEPIQQLLPRLREGGVLEVSPNGVLGDPSGASSDEGRSVLAAMVSSAHKDVLGQLAERTTDAGGGAA